MLETILGALLPMVVTFLLGFVAARRADFGPTDAAILNRMALRYAVPLMLFAGTVSTPRAELPGPRRPTRSTRNWLGSTHPGSITNGTTLPARRSKT
jgi:hypothetical protein